jgi:hypothetical protein
VIELVNRQSPGVTGEWAWRWLDHERRAEKSQEWAPDTC